LDFISAILQEGKGLRDCLQLLNLADDSGNVEEPITNLAGKIDHHGIALTLQNNKHTEDVGQPELPGQDVGPLATRNVEEIGIFEGDDDNESQLQSSVRNGTVNIDPNADIQENAESTVNPSKPPQRSENLDCIPVVSLSASPSPSGPEEEEELLEYDDNSVDRTSAASVLELLRGPQDDNEGLNRILVMG
jgi:hypothetical protein